jgi:hypothetical protein
VWTEWKNSNFYFSSFDSLYIKRNIFFFFSCVRWWKIPNDMNL